MTSRRSHMMNIRDDCLCHGMSACYSLDTSRLLTFYVPPMLRSTILRLGLTVWQVYNYLK